MAEYKRRYSNNQKRRKLAKFNSIYYEGDPDNWKVSRLPNWMNFYGNSLDMELKGKLPTYYRKFKQGTVVMIDYGVPVGNELGGKHFGVVISNNDTKYKRKITVIPLSSKYHRGYVNLGYDLMEGILTLGTQRSIELKEAITKANTRLQDFNANSASANFNFTPDEVQFLVSHNISLDIISKSHVNVNLENKKSFQNLIISIKNLDKWEEYPNIFNFVSFIETGLNFQDSMSKQIDKFEKDFKELNKLRKKFEKYNKQSYAVISDIKSVSKLKVTKLNHYTISGNTRISDYALNKIKFELIKTIE